MKFMRFVAFLVISTGIISGCQKEITEDNFDPVDPPSTNDSIYLDRIYDLYDEGSGIDTQAISRLVYDNQKRVIAIIDSSMDGTLENDSLLYAYHGTDTLPYKMSERNTVDPVFGYDYSDVYFFYNTQGKKLQDSVIYTYVNSSGDVNIYTSVFKYSYGSNLIYGQTWSKADTDPAFELIHKDTAIVNGNGDVLSSKRYKLIAGNYVLNTTATFTYDGRRSPFSMLSMFKAHRMLPNGETILGEYMGFQNVVSQQEYTIDMAYTFSQNFTYEYNTTTGLPKKARSDIGTPDEGALIFTYKNL